MWWHSCEMRCFHENCWRLSVPKIKIDSVLSWKHSSHSEYKVSLLLVVVLMWNKIMKCIHKQFLGNFTLWLHFYVLFPLGITKPINSSIWTDFCCISIFRFNFSSLQDSTRSHFMMVFAIKKHKWWKVIFVTAFKTLLSWLIIF